MTSSNPSVPDGGEYDLMLLSKCLSALRDAGFPPGDITIKYGADEKWISMRKGLRACAIRLNGPDSTWLFRETIEGKTETAGGTGQRASCSEVDMREVLCWLDTVRNMGAERRFRR